MERRTTRGAGSAKPQVAARMLLGYLIATLSVAGLAQPDDLAMKSKRASEAMNAGRFREAVPLYQELVQALPENTGMMMNLGLALHSAGEYRKAIDQFRVVLEQRPGFTAAWLMLGLGHLKLGEPGNAVDPLRRVISIEPSNEVARLELADACLSLGRPAEAAEHFGKLAQIVPDNPKAWQGLGLSYAALARRSFSQLESKAPESGYLYMLMARSREEQQQYQSAFSFYRQALEKSPGLRGAHLAVAEIYRKTGHSDWGMVEEQRERDIPPPDCTRATLECRFLEKRYQTLLAEANGTSDPEWEYWRARAYDELSREAFARLGELTPSAEIHELLALAYRLRGLHHESVKECREALKLVPRRSGEFLRLQKELAQSLWLERDYTTARGLLEQFVKLEPAAPDLNFQLGDTLLELQETQKALPYLEKASQLSPSSLPARASLARAYLRAGQAVKAIPHFRAALPIDEDGSLLYQLARAYRATGQDKLAQEAMQKFDQISQSAQARRQKTTEEYQITPP